MPPLRRSPPPSPSDGKGQEYTNRTLFPGDGHALSMSPTKASPRGTASPRGPTSPMSPIGNGGGGGGARLATLVLAISSVVASVSLFATVVTMDMSNFTHSSDNDKEENSVARLSDISYEVVEEDGLEEEKLEIFDEVF